VKVVRAEGLGFCFGVRRAIEMTTAAAKDGPLFTLGAVVHNAGVARALADAGARAAFSLDEIPAGGRVAVTAHGVGPSVLDEVGHRGLAVIDATCPIVRRVQQEAAACARAGLLVLVYGDASHPEVAGILGWTEGRGVATLDAQDADRLAEGSRGLGLVAQTTSSTRDFQAFAREVRRRVASREVEVRMLDTVCPETTRRYDAAARLACDVEVMVVVGSPSSANTRRLVEVSREAGVTTHAVERAGDLVSAWFDRVARCGVTAGTSTPASEVDGVVARLEALSV